MDRLIREGDGSFSVELQTGRKMVLQPGTVMLVQTWLHLFRISDVFLNLFALQIAPNAKKLSTFEEKQNVCGYASWIACRLGLLSCSNLCRILANEPLYVFSLKLDEIPLAVFTPSRDLLPLVDSILQSGFRQIKSPLTCLLLVADSYDEHFSTLLAEPCFADQARWEITEELSRNARANAVGGPE